MVSGLCCEYASVTSASLSVVLFVVLKAYTKSTESTVSVNFHLLLYSYVESSIELLTLVLLTGILCCADPADIPAEDGSTVD